VPVEVEEVELRPLGPIDVLIRVTAANACVTDAMFMGLGASAEHPLPFPLPMPQIMGHGAVGVVEAVGEGVRWTRTGDRVVATGNPLCRTCWYCSQGRPDQCVGIVLSGPVLGRTADGAEVFPNANIGGYAEHAIVPEIHVTPVETEVPDDELALLADGLGGGLGGALLVSPVDFGSNVAVFGCGACGLGYVQGARLRGAERIFAVDPIESRRQLAVELGATDALDPSAGDVVETILGATPDRGGMYPRGVEYAFEASGDERAIEQAFAVTRSAGHVVLASVPWNLAASVSLPAVPLAIFGKTIHSCQWGHINIVRDLARLIRLLERGEVRAGPLVGGHVRLDELEPALNRVAARETMSAVVTPTP